VPSLFGQYLATRSARRRGAHQLGRISCAPGCRAAVIELKTVQIMDDWRSPPCIDLADEGYNVEWSQELKLNSRREYVKAWALIHVLHRLLGYEETPVGTVFNMSVGYNLAGTQSPPMVRFMDRLADASQELAEIQAS